MQHDVDREFRTQNIFSNVTSGICLVECGRYALLCKRHLATDVEEALRQAGCVTRNQATFDELMWVALHQQAIFVGAWLAFVTINHQVSRPHVLWRQPPLCAGWKPCTTAPKNCRTFHFVMYFGCWFRQCFSNRGVTICGYISLNGERIAVLKARCHHLWAIAGNKSWCVWV